MFARRRPQLFCQQPCAAACPKVAAVVLSMRCCPKAVRLPPPPRATLRTPAAARVARDAPVIDACCAGTAAVRTALPARSRATVLPLPCRHATATHARGMRPHGVLGWTPSRPPAGSIESNRVVPSGRACWVTCRATVRVPLGTPRIATVIPPNATHLYYAGVTESTS